MPTDYKQVLHLLGRQGDFKEGVLTVNIPRSDLKVAIDGVATPTPFGFGGWVAKGDRWPFSAVLVIPVVSGR